MKRIVSLLKIAGMKFEFQKLKIHFHKRQVSFLFVICTLKLNLLTDAVNIQCDIPDRYFCFIVLMKP